MKIIGNGSATDKVKPGGGGGVRALKKEAEKAWEVL